MKGRSGAPREGAATRRRAFDQYFVAMHRLGAPWWTYPCAASFLLYFALLLFCDLGRPVDDGIYRRGMPDHSGLLVEKVEPGSPAAAAGVKQGDVIVGAAGHEVRTPVDWEAIQSTVRIGRPVALEFRRDGQIHRAEMAVVRAGPSYWRHREGFSLLVTRAVQFVSLLLGLMVVFKKPFDFGARVGGWLLATIGTLCIVFPSMVFDVWSRLPGIVGAALWLPFSSTFALPALLLSFFLLFPRRVVRSPAVWLLTWVPAGFMVYAHVAFFSRVVYAPDLPRQVVSWFDWRWVAWIGYLVAAGVAAAVAYRAADAVERRRIGVMLLGGGVGAVAGGPIALAYWRSSETGLFGSRTVGFATLMLLAVPLSFAYAILRHRLFDVRLIIRQGVRYALARRLLVSIVPLVLLGLVVDIYRNRDLAVAELFGVRAPAYLAVAAVALLAQWQRQNWLLALDRRFFRERYDAQRLLRGVVDELHRADSIAQAAAQVVSQMEAALHPSFVVLMAREPGRDVYARMAGAPGEAGPAELPGGTRLMALARALGKPLDLAAAGTGWLTENLPATELEWVQTLGLELIVPVESTEEQAETVLVFGARRSEEPYTPEDQELLWTIARSLGVLARRDPSMVGGATFQECPRCGSCYDSGTPECAADTSALAQVSLPRTLSGRYRLEQRLGRGGMGVVYAATDLSLGRSVAVKVLREELVGDAESAARFQEEARISARFTHPHVVTIHDFGIIQGARAFLVMERLDGITLREAIVRQGPLDAARVLAIMRGVCRAVESAHRRNLVHRDLKPENVFLASNDGAETPKVLDFGIAKVLAGSQTGAVRDTRGGVMLGTPQYMAPEQLRGEAPAPSWDLWALGVMTCEMLTGCHPFASLAFGLSSDGMPTARPAIAGEFGIEPAWQPSCRGGWRSSRRIAPGDRGRPPRGTRADAEAGVARGTAPRGAHERSGAAGRAARWTPVRHDALEPGDRGRRRPDPAIPARRSRGCANCIGIPCMPTSGGGATTRTRRKT